MKTKGLKILSVIVGVLILSIGNGYAQSHVLDTIMPIYSGTITGNCFMVGNTNTEVNFTDPAAAAWSGTVERGGTPLKPIFNMPAGSSSAHNDTYYETTSSTTPKTFTIENVNHADFCIEDPGFCGTLEILCTRLTCGNKLRYTDFLPFAEAST